MTTRDSTVCVIGAGPAGLCAVKHCLENGLAVHCYEARSQLGGLWATSEITPGTAGEAAVQKRSGVHARFRLLSSQFVASFSDFPLPDDLTPSLHNCGRFLHPGAFREYIERYANRFSLRPHIVCRMEVVRVERCAEDVNGFRWAVTVRSKRAVERTSRHRFVIITTGPCTQARLPELSGAETSGISVLHSSWLRNPHALFRDRTVLVAGGGCSAGDTVQSALEAGARCVTWAASGSSAVACSALWLLSRYPFDGQSAWDEWPLQLLRLLPKRLLARLLIGACVPAFHADMKGVRPLDLDRDRLLVLDTDVITAGIASDRLVVSPAGVKGFSAREVLLTDGTEAAAEVCVLATGFQANFPFLSEAPSPSELHHGILPVSPDAWGLAFAHVSPFVGPSLPIAEMEVRWVTHHWARNRLVSEQDRLRLIAKHRPSTHQTPSGSSGLTRLWRELERAEVLARDIGCAPAVWRLLLSPFPTHRRAGLALLAGPWLPQRFRLRGTAGTAAAAMRTLVGVSKDACGWKFFALLDGFEVVFHACVGFIAYYFYRRITRR